MKRILLLSAALFLLGSAGFSQKMKIRSEKPEDHVLSIMSYNIHSPISGCVVKKETVEDVLSFIDTLEKGSAVYVLSRIDTEEKMLIERLVDLKQQGLPYWGKHTFSHS